MASAPEHPKDIFRDFYAKISEALGQGQIFEIIISKLFAENLIYKYERASVTTQHNLDDFRRGSNVTGFLYNRVDDSDKTKAKERLLLICKVFDTSDDESLKDIAAEMRGKACGSSYQSQRIGSTAPTHGFVQPQSQNLDVANGEGQEEVDAPIIPKFCNVDKWCPPIDSPLDFEVKSDNIEGRVKDVNVILVTATDTELRAVIGCRDTEKECIILDAPGVIFYLAWYAEYHIAIVKTGQGETRTRQKVTKVQGVVHAEYAIAIGICYGMKPKGTLDIGDIIVSEKIKNITNTREQNDGPLFRVDEYPVDENLLSVLSTLGIGFKFEKELGSDKFVQVNKGVLVSETSLVASQARKDKILSQIPEALGGEMEGNGLMEAANEKNFCAIVVKAVADWGNEHKEPYRKSQNFAAVAAAKYVYACLNKFKNALNK